MRLILLSDDYAVCRLPPAAAIPDWASGAFVSIARTRDELSIICPAVRVPADTRAEAGWRCLKVQGPLDFNQVGVLASLVGPLAAAGVSVMATATFDTDYLLVRAGDLDQSMEALRLAGHTVKT